jgi:hypothetical protein
VRLSAKRFKSFRLGRRRSSKSPICTDRKRLLALDLSSFELQHVHETIRYTHTEQRSTLEASRLGIRQRHSE